MDSLRQSTAQRSIQPISQMLAYRCLLTIVECLVAKRAKMSKALLVKWEDRAREVKGTIFLNYANIHYLLGENALSEEKLNELKSYHSLHALPAPLMAAAEDLSKKLTPS